MKRLLAPLFLTALLTGCVTVPHDGYGYHRSTTVVTGNISSSYSYPSDYYSRAPVYVQPAPIYVQPAPVVRFHYHRQHAPVFQPPSHRHGEHRARDRRTDDGRHGRSETRSGRQSRDDNDGQRGRFRTR